MKRIFISIILATVFCSFTNSAFADMWDNYENLDNAWDGQKTITNKEFETVMDALQEKKKKKEAKANKKKIKKISGGGESLYKEMAPDKDIKELQSLKENNDGILINIPARIQVGENILDSGFYNLYAERDDNGVPYICFYQSQYLMGKIKAFETDDDFNHDTLNFAEVLPYDNNFFKIIFGSLEFNAYAFVNILN